MRQRRRKPHARKHLKLRFAIFGRHLRDRLQCLKEFGQSVIGTSREFAGQALHFRRTRLAPLRRAGGIQRKADSLPGTIGELVCRSIAHQPVFVDVDPFRSRRLDCSLRSQARGLRLLECTLLSMAVRLVRMGQGLQLRA